MLSRMKDAAERPEVAPEVTAIIARAAAGGVQIPRLLAAADVDASMWWRYTNAGRVPLLPTIRKLNAALAKLEAACSTQ